MARTSRASRAALMRAAAASHSGSSSGVAARHSSRALVQVISPATR